MILGVMQPYFFPYLGYFDLINYADNWIVFDKVQYIRHGWINRNRILHPKKGWQYIIVPLKKHGRSTVVKDIKVSDDQKWRSCILGQINHYKKHAPYYHETYSLVSESLTIQETSLSRLNVAIMNKICNYLQIPFNPKYFSEMDLGQLDIECPGDWAFYISQALGASEYVNPPGGIELFDPAKFAEVGIKLTIRNMHPLVYTCYGYEFIADLSIIDVLMWNSPNKVKHYLDVSKEHYNQKEKDGL